MTENRSKMIFVSSIWVYIYSIYSYLIINSIRISDLEKFFVALFVFPFFFLYQLIVYNLFKEYKNRLVYNVLFIIKCLLFLAQPIFIKYIPLYSKYNHILFVLTAICVFIIDYHIMKLKNKVNLSSIHLSEEEKVTIKTKVFEILEAQRSTLFPVFLLFNLYTMGIEKIEITTIIFYGLIFWFICFKRLHKKTLLLLITFSILALILWVSSLELVAFVEGIIVFSILVQTYILLNKMTISWKYFKQK
ncbi:hypothetical protein [Anaerobranca gottschalkii]|uniref:Uncharacterized protein n=1 Tax=Anaerobranca gottschalkii DSM 13577 TaxID=1120990 RepID=A0A1I0CQR7_9FIRM|nr:hypothetical protein [Anaerobranca gottschalkii]SET22118.1 hypothetical protein SAMN03080614_10885 [Anaerobranca gottschalkii DSM 13577]